MAKKPEDSSKEELPIPKPNEQEQPKEQKAEDLMAALGQKDYLYLIQLSNINTNLEKLGVLIQEIANKGEKEE